LLASSLAISLHNLLFPSTRLANANTNANSLAGRPGFEAVWPTPWLPRAYMTRRMPSRWRKLVEAVPPCRPTTWLGRQTFTWRQTDLSKSMEVPFTPLNTPLTVKVETPHSTCSFPLVKVPV
jgi:hypothetical protein